MELNEQSPQSQPVASETPQENEGIYLTRTYWNLSDSFKKQFEKTKGKYYLYALIRPDKDGEYFYIGKGKGKRIFKHFCKSEKKINLHKWNIIQKILKNGYKREEIIKILMICDSEEYVKEMEIKLIAKIGRINTKTGSLTNLTDGGEGLSGLKFSEESKRKMSNAKKGKPSLNRGIKWPEEMKRKISETLKGKSYISIETRKKMAENQMGEKNQFYGKKHSKESIKKMSESHMGNTARKKIPIVAYKEDELIYFSSIKDAYEKGLKNCRNVLNKKRNHCKGYCIRYATLEEIKEYEFTRNI